MGAKPVWCEVCNKPFRPKSRTAPCPHCSGSATPSDARLAALKADDPITNTLAPPGDEGRDFERFAAPPDRLAPPPPVVIDSPRVVIAGEINCPECAERIKAAAKSCRFCGADVTEKGARLRRRERHRTPVRRAAEGDCRCGGWRVPKTPVWTIVLAIILFPIGLLFLLVKEQRCSRCGL